MKIVAIKSKVWYHIFLIKTCVFLRHTVQKKAIEELDMDDEKYFIVKKKAIPEVLLKVVEAKRLIDTEEAMTVQDAADLVGISRSSFYKYQNDIFPFHENNRGRTITFMLQMDDQPGLLSCVLAVVAKHNANILTIHQSIPVNSVASLTISVEIRPDSEDSEILFASIEKLKGIHYLKILARE